MPWTSCGTPSSWRSLPNSTSPFEQGRVKKQIIGRWQKVASVSVSDERSWLQMCAVRPAPARRGPMPTSPTYAPRLLPAAAIQSPSGLLSGHLFSFSAIEKLRITSHYFLFFGSSRITIKPGALLILQRRTLRSNFIGKKRREGLLHGLIDLHMGYRRVYIIWSS